MLVALVGIIFAIVRWKQHPNVSLLAILGFSLVLANRMVWFLFQVWQFANFPYSSWTLTLFRVVSVLLTVVSYGLLVAAIFGSRSVPNPKDPSNVS